MKRPPGHRRFVSLARKFLGTDAELAALLATSPSTLSRLKAGKIQKMERYVIRLESKLGPQRSDLRSIVTDLENWARESPQLLAMLRSLRDVAQESAEF